MKPKKISMFFKVVIPYKYIEDLVNEGMSIKEACKYLYDEHSIWWNEEIEFERAVIHNER